MIGLPDSWLVWVSWTYWPLLSVIVHGVFAVPAGTPEPAAIALFGRIVTVVLSTAATMLCDGPSPGMLIGGAGNTSYAPTAM